MRRRCEIERGGNQCFRKIDGTQQISCLSVGVIGAPPLTERAEHPTAKIAGTALEARNVAAVELDVVAV